jgi:hypothetical protein
MQPLSDHTDRPRHTELASAGWTQRARRILSAVALAAVMLTLTLGSVSRAGASDLPAHIVRDPLVAAVLSQVTTRTLVYELQALTGDRPVVIAGITQSITTRFTGLSTPISNATRYAYDQLAQTSLSVTFQTYTVSDLQLRNVVAEKPGEDPASDDIYLITAHLDSTTVDPDNNPAPGADDNGSGSVAVLMAARLLAPYHLSDTVRFVLFTGEEQGLWGSQAYAAECEARGDDIRGVLNLDMIGYNTDEPVFDVYARSGDYRGAAESRELAAVFSDVVSVYGLDLVPRLVFVDGYPLRYGSDQWSFLELGYPGILIIEDYAGGDFNPNYHKPSDRIDPLDLDYLRDITRAAVATIAHLGGAWADMGHLSGTIRAIGTHQPLSATVSALGNLSPDAFPGTGAGSYSLILPAGRYTLTVSALPDYCPTTVSGLPVGTSTTTIQDVLLPRCPRWYLPLLLTVGDVTAGPVSPWLDGPVIR